MDAMDASRPRRVSRRQRMRLGISLLLTLLLALAAAWLLGGTAPSASAMRPEPPLASAAVSDGSAFPRYVRHGALPDRAALAQTLRLLRQSHDRSTSVRILFYGQSITEQGWWKLVVAHLRATYPHAELQIENRAIGGHGATLLRKTAEADVFPFQPDLVIFQVYGSHHDYEALIQSIREQTTADVMVASDHVNEEAQVAEDTQPLRLMLRSWLYRVPHLVSAATRDDNWTAWMNYDFLPALARRHGVQLVDVRDQWKAYLTANRLRVGDLLRDAVHLDAQGQSLMASIVGQYLEPDPALVDAATDDRIVEIGVSSAADAPGRPLRVVFEGTRVDALAAGTPASGVPILVDGKAPCSLAGSHRFDRVTAYPGSNWPALLRVQPGSTPLLDETWTLTLLQMNDDLSQVRFSVSGSATGADGEGSSNARFVSRSGRLVIEPGDWDLAYGKTVIGTPVPPGFRIVWHSACHGTDVLPAGTAGDTAPRTLVQGIANAQHVLVLPAAAAASLRALRVYRPPEGRH